MNAQRRRLIALLVLTLGSGIAILDGTIVTLALPRIAADLGGGLSAQQWIIDGYMLSLASFLFIRHLP
jgi:MFS family permease